MHDAKQTQIVLRRTKHAFRIRAFLITIMHRIMRYALTRIMHMTWSMNNTNNANETKRDVHFEYALSRESSFDVLIFENYILSITHHDYRYVFHVRKCAHEIQMRFFIIERETRCNNQTQIRNDVIQMIKIDAFENEYIDTSSIDLIETITQLTRKYVARQCTFVSSNYEHSISFNRATRNIVMKTIHLIVEHEIERYYVDDLRDDVYTLFHQYDWCIACNRKIKRSITCCVSIDMQ